MFSAFCLVCVCVFSELLTATNYSWSLSEEDRPQSLAAKLSGVISILTVVCPCDRWIMLSNRPLKVVHTGGDVIFSALLCKSLISTWTHSHLLLQAYWDLFIVAIRFTDQIWTCKQERGTWVLVWELFQAHNWWEMWIKSGICNAAFIKTHTK